MKVLPPQDENAILDEINNQTINKTKNKKNPKSIKYCQKKVSQEVGRAILHIANRG